MHISRTITCVCLIAWLTHPAAAQWVGEWKLDETSGTTANDITPNANHGTLMNFGPTPWVAGKFGNALTFDGVDDYVELKGGKGIPVYDGKGSPYTIAFWVKAPAQHDRRVYAEGGNLGNNSPIITFGTGRNTNTTTDKFQVYIRNDTGRVVLEGYSNATVFDDTWHHVAWVETSGDPTLYVDGVKDTSTSFRYHAGYGPRSPNYGNFSMHVASIGAVLRQGACCWLLGSIDDLRVYDFAVLPTDISLMMINVPLTPCRASIGSFGHKCNGRLSLDATGNAVFGSNLTMQLTAGTPGATAMVLAGLGVHELDLGLFGFTGCVAYPGLTNTLLIPIGMLDPSGTSVPLPVSVPTGPASITCLILAVQGVAISSGTLGMSNSLLLQVGN